MAHPSHEASGSAHIAALTGVRALGALWVLGFHACDVLLTLLPELRATRPLLARGYLGVDLFFALSGWVLAHSYGPRLAAGRGPGLARFAWQRLARIYPVHLTVLAVLVAGRLLAGAFGFERYATSPLWDVRQLPAQLALVHAWGAGDAAWNVPSWSLSCEWLGYLAFPVLIPRVMRLEGRRAGIGAVAVLGLGLAALRARYGTSLDLTHAGGIFRFSIEFVAGVLLCRWQRAAGDRWPWDLGVAALALLAVPAALHLGLDALAAAGLVLLVPCIARGRGAAARLLGSGPFVHAGRVSFSLYMVHEPVLLIVESRWPAARHAEASLGLRLAHAGAVLAGVWLLAEAMYRWVEEPARTFMAALPERLGANGIPLPRRTEERLR